MPLTWYKEEIDNPSGKTILAFDVGFYAGVKGFWARVAEPVLMVKDGNSWKDVDLSHPAIAVTFGKAGAFAVISTEVPYQRNGISPSQPDGTGWEERVCCYTL